MDNKGMTIESLVYTMLGTPEEVQAELDASPTFPLGMPAIAGAPCLFEHSPPVLEGPWRD